jgi:hypothetical protein
MRRGDTRDSTDNYPPLSAQQVAQVETRLGFRLPSLLRTIYLWRRSFSLMAPSMILTAGGDGNDT